MDHKLISPLSEKDNELYQRIDEVLHYIWDPIGVSGIPEARDEYYSYIPEVFRLAKKKNSDKEIVEYLKAVVTQNIGLEFNNSKCNEVAEIINKWSDLLNCNS